MTAGNQPSRPPGNKNEHPSRMPPGSIARPARPVAVPSRAAVSPGDASAAATPVTGLATDEQPEGESRRGWLAGIRQWGAEAGGAYLASLLFHTALMLLLFLVLGARYIQQKLAGGPAFDTVDVAPAASPPANLLKLPQGWADDDDDRHKPLLPDPGENDRHPTEGVPNIPVLASLDNEPIRFDAGGLGFEGEPVNALQPAGLPDLRSVGMGPAVDGGAKFNPNNGLGREPGNRGPGKGYGHRPWPSGPPGGSTGPDGPAERSVAEALKWLVRHQNRDGSWSLSKFSVNCKNGLCNGHGTADSDAAATALALLPFLGAGHTHLRRGPYQQVVYHGLNWLIGRQNRTTGDLAAGSNHLMYTHGLATMALCEAFGMSQDSRVGDAAQRAINFIQNAQDRGGGGWRYHPGEPGDTSVVGWQVMALKSGQMAGLKVDLRAFEGARKFLAAASGSEYGGKFGYLPGTAATPTMSGVGLLCRQYLGAHRDDPGITEGTKFLMANPPDVDANRNTYYWYYATQVMHNLQGDDWETWDRRMRRILKKSQERQGCAAGSWDPDKPTADAWGRQGGRLMMTSLSCLTLEVYYRNLPLYDLSKKGAVKGELD